MRPSNCDRSLVNKHLQPGVLVRTALFRKPHSSTACLLNCNRHLQPCSNQHIQCGASSIDNNAQHTQGAYSAVEQFARSLKLPRLHVAPDAHQASAAGMASMASGPVSAITQYTGERMLQLNLGTRHLNPFTEVVWRRGPRRWKGLRTGPPIRIERPAPWLLDLRHHMQDLRHRLFSLQNHFTAPNMLMAAALVAGLLLAALLVQKALHRQGRQQAQPLDDPEVLARKAASLDQQRSRFRRALGGEDDVPEMQPALAADTVSASTQAHSLLPTDSAVSENGLDGFDAWDEDTQKQWKRFMRGSRSQEIEEEQWWDIDRDEVPPDRQVYQDFN